MLCVFIIRMKGKKYHHALPHMLVQRDVSKILLQNMKRERRKITQKMLVTTTKFGNKVLQKDEIVLREGNLCREKRVYCRPCSIFSPPPNRPQSHTENVCALSLKYACCQIIPASVFCVLNCISIGEEKHKYMANIIQDNAQTVTYFVIRNTNTASSTKAVLPIFGCACLGKSVRRRVRENILVREAQFPYFPLHVV